MRITNTNNGAPKFKMNSKDFEPQIQPLRIGLSKSHYIEFDFLWLIAEPLRRQAEGAREGAQLVANELKQQLEDISRRNIGIHQNMNNLTQTLNGYRAEIAQLQFDHGSLQADLAKEKQVSARIERERADLKSKYYP